MSVKLMDNEIVCDRNGYRRQLKIKLHSVITTKKNKKKRLRKEKISRKETSTKREAIK